MKCRRWFIERRPPLTYIAASLITEGNQGFDDSVCRFELYTHAERENESIGYLNEINIQILELTRKNHAGVWKFRGYVVISNQNRNDENINPEFLAAMKERAYVIGEFTDDDSERTGWFERDENPNFLSH